MHEICFVYQAEDVYEGALREEYFIEVDAADFAKHDIRPIELIDIINGDSDHVRHVIIGR